MEKVEGKFSYVKKRFEVIERMKGFEWKETHSGGMYL